MGVVFEVKSLSLSLSNQRVEGVGTELIQKAHVCTRRTTNHVAKTARNLLKSVRHELLFTLIQRTVFTCQCEATLLHQSIRRTADDLFLRRLKVLLAGECLEHRTQTLVELF